MTPLSPHFPELEREQEVRTGLEGNGGCRVSRTLPHTVLAVEGWYGKSLKAQDNCGEEVGLAFDLLKNSALCYQLSTETKRTDKVSVKEKRVERGGGERAQLGDRKTGSRRGGGTKLEYYGFPFINVLVTQNYQLKRAC